MYVTPYAYTVRARLDKRPRPGHIELMTKFIAAIALVLSLASAASAHCMPGFPPLPPLGCSGKMTPVCMCDASGCRIVWLCQ